MFVSFYSHNYQRHDINWTISSLWTQQNKKEKICDSGLRQLKMAPSKTACHVFDEKDRNDILDLKSLAGSSTTRNVVDLLLVVIILVLLNVAAPIIRGDYCGRFNI